MAVYWSYLQITIIALYRGLTNSALALQVGRDTSPHPARWFMLFTANQPCIFLSAALFLSLPFNCMTESWLYEEKLCHMYWDTSCTRHGHHGECESVPGLFTMFITVLPSRLYIFSLIIIIFNKCSLKYDDVLSVRN